VTDSIGPIKPVARSQIASNARLETSITNNGARSNTATTEAKTPQQTAALSVATPIVRPGALQAALSVSVTSNTLRLRTGAAETSSESSSRSSGLLSGDEAKRSTANGLFAFGKVNALSKREQRRNRLRNAFEFAFNRIVTEEELLGLPIVRPNFFTEKRNASEEIELVRVLRRLLAQYQTLVDRENLLTAGLGLNSDSFVLWLREIIEAFKESIDWIALDQIEASRPKSAEALDWVSPVSEALDRSLQTLGATKGQLITDRKAAKRFPSRFDRMLKGSRTGSETEMQIRDRARKCDSWAEFLVALSQIRMLVITTAIALP
jgi:hypothetical protein